MKEKGIAKIRVLFRALARLFLLPLTIVVYGCSIWQTPNEDIVYAPRNQQEEVTAPEGDEQPAGSHEIVGGPGGNVYRIQIGDAFDVKVYNNPELDENLVVRPDGRISLLLADEIQAAGLTPPELDRLISEIYSEKLNNPEIAIIMRRFAGNRVYVGGEVNNPTEVLFDGRLSLLQAIYKAGGFKETAKLKSVVLLRDQGTDSPEVILVDVRKILDIGQGDIALRPFDAIFVSKTTIAKADQFVDQYINKIVPRNFTAGISWVYNLTPWIEVFDR